MSSETDELAQALAKAAEAICEAALLQEEIDGAGAAAGFEDAKRSQDDLVAVQK